MPARLTLEILGAATGAVAALGKTKAATKDAEGATKSATSSLGKLAAGVATGYAVHKVVDFGKSTVEAAKTAAGAHKRLAAVFAATGDATGEAAKKAEDFAGSLSKQIGVTAPVIENGQALLATFKSVSGEAGRSAGIFDRATAAAADLAAAGFGDLSSNSVQLGKALEDPTKGITALARSGVTFTDSQKKAITAMVKSGDLLGAQKEVLAAVEGQVKGTAKATAGAAAKQNVAYDEMKTKLGTEILPILSKFAQTLTKLFDFVAANSSWLVPLVTGLVGLAAAAIGVAKAVEIVKSVIGGMRIAWQLLNLAFLESPIGWVVLALVALGVALYLLWTKVDWFQAGVKAAWAAIQAAFVTTINWIKGALAAFVSFLAKWGTTILAVMLGPFGIVFALIIAFVRGGWAGVMAQLNQWAGMITGALGAVLRVISYPFLAAWGVIYSGLIAPIRGAFSGVAGAIAGALAGVTNAIVRPFTDAWALINWAVIGPLKSAWNFVANTINGISISTPAVSLAGHEVIPAFSWRPPFHIPTLAQGGLITSTGIIYAHAGEVISPAPRSARGAGGDVYINLNVPAVANPAEVGRQTVRMLQAYVRAQGPESLAKGLGLAPAP
jgi:hypothetical protein